jgi:hypothetical protein
MLEQAHQNSKDTATSTFPPAASSVLIAISLLIPRSIRTRMSLSGYLLAGAGGACLPAVVGRALGTAPIVCPPPGKDGGFRDCSPELVLAGVGSTVNSPESMMRAWWGSSCSERKRTSRFWIRRTFFSRSMHAWWALSMSKPRRRSTSRPWNRCD